MNTAIKLSSVSYEKVLQCALRGSRFAQRLIDSDKELLPWLREQYPQPCTSDEMATWLDSQPVTDENSLSHALRWLRKRVMLKLLARDLAGLAGLDEVMTCMSALAEMTVQRAHSFLMQNLVQQYGQPVGELSGTPQQMRVVGMGKLGGKELNVSSDIDLIFAYPEDGTCNGARGISNHDFFTRFGRRLISLISDLTPDGYVFRVDMRLRPYGDSGPLVMSFAAVEEYLIEQGREWERYAWIKARVISPPDNPASQELMKLVQPFVYRKYLDFGTFESMRKLHAQISQEVQRRDRINHIKLGPGGIREIEFIAQVFQLIRGGREPGLRIRPTLQVLNLLGESGQIEPDIVMKLSTAYIFLRNLEHRLQYLDDQQTHDLPRQSEDQSLIAESMGYQDYPAMLVQLNLHRALVSEQFAHIFSTQKNDSESNVLWRENISSEELNTGLKNLGYADGMSLAKRLLQIRDSARYRQLPDSSRQRMDKLIPQFIQLCAGSDNRNQTLPRILNLLESVSRRASYLAFMAEYPKVLPRLVRLASASEWACEYLVQHPILLDELLDTREIYLTPDWTARNDELLAQLEQCSTDTECQMDLLRQFQHGQIFHLLAMDLQGLLPLELLCDHLSSLADLILQQVLRLCWQNARKRHQPQAQFAIIAYGKLGGRELGYAGDLDLIFLYDDPHPDAAEIYARLAQRINTMISSYTAAGRLYEIDLRLRPNGASGLLVSTIEAFTEYQQNQAWAWEHQALTRARFCAGDEQIGRQFTIIREQVLRKQRDLNTLRLEIVSMRKKMLDSHPNNSGLFDIKHDRGGMVDIEFIVQFLILAHAHTQPELTVNKGNLALLKIAGELGLIKMELAEAASNCYRILRALQHKMRLNNQSPCRIDRKEIDTTPVVALWTTLLGQD